MNIYTSYYANCKNLDESKYMLISISRTHPKGFKIAKIPAFAPSKDLLSLYKTGTMSDDDYTKIYTDEISYIDIREQLKVLCPLAHGRDLVMLCWEAPDKFCHRHILANLIWQQYGYRVHEL